MGVEIADDTAANVKKNRRGAIHLGRDGAVDPVIQYAHRQFHRPVLNVASDGNRPLQFIDHAFMNRARLRRCHVIKLGGVLDAGGVQEAYDCRIKGSRCQGFSPLGDDEGGGMPCRFGAATMSKSSSSILRIRSAKSCALPRNNVSLRPMEPMYQLS